MSPDKKQPNSTVWKNLPSQSTLASNLRKLVMPTIAALLMTLSYEADAQQIVDFKKYKEITEAFKQKQEPIGENMAKFLFGGEMEQYIQEEIQKQTFEGVDPTKISLFKNVNIKDSRKSTVLSVADIEKELKDKLDSILQVDFTTFYTAFRDFEKSGTNIIGTDQKKDIFEALGIKSYLDLEGGWHIVPAVVDVDIDYFDENAKNLPYDKKGLESVEKKMEWYYNSYLSKWKDAAQSNRSSKDKSQYKAADAIALQKEFEVMKEKMYKDFVKPVVDRLIKEYYSRESDVINQK